MKHILIALLFFAVSTTIHAATYIDRQAAIADALVDGTATSAQKLAAADAFVAHYRDIVINEYELDPDTLTNAQKAALMVIMIKRHVRTLVKMYDADIGTAKSALETAVSDAEAAAETAWPTETVQ